MADRLTPEERSRNMAAIRSRDTKPERYLRRLLFLRGYRFRKPVQRLPGKPDIFLRKYSTAIFVHGCFWHRHRGCSQAAVPGTRKDFWLAKFERNVARDREVRKALKLQGIRVLTVWECTLDRMARDERVRERKMARIEAFLASDMKALEL